MKLCPDTCEELIVLKVLTPWPLPKFISETRMEPSELILSTIATWHMPQAACVHTFACRIAPTEGLLLTEYPWLLAASSQLDALHKLFPTGLPSCWRRSKTYHVQSPQ